VRRRLGATRTVSVFAVTVALAATGCGGEGQTQPVSEEREEALFAFAECMREQGIDVRDPEPGDAGLSFTGPEGKFDPEDTAKARQACRDELGGSFVEQEEEQLELKNDKLLAFARCMRQEGFEFPDPDVSENHPGLGDYIQKYSDPGDPEFEKADDTCRLEVFGHRNRGPGGSGGAETAN
jgi:hypothetical protein